MRVEMVGSTVDSTTTYEPYGKLLARTGTSGTVYGYTGEQHDGATGLVYLRARYYSPNLKVFMSVDPFPGYMRHPSTQHGYNYVSNNPVNKTDPSGLCEQYLPDEACWAVYEQIVHEFPQVLNQPQILNLFGHYNKELHELSEGHLRAILRYLRENANAQPLDPLIKKPDAVGIYGGLAPPQGGFSGQAGIEVIYNLHNGDMTFFLVLGFGGSVGMEAGADGLFVLVYNIDDNNLDYSGDFISAGASVADLVGVSGQYSITPADLESLERILSPRNPYSISIGLFCGVGASVNWGRTEYIPIVTVNMKYSKPPEYHLRDYVYNTDNEFDRGFLTHFVMETIPDYYSRIREFTEEMGWE